MERFKFKFLIEDNEGKLFVTKEYNLFKDIKEDNLISEEVILNEAEEWFPYEKCNCFNESNAYECNCQSRFDEGKVIKMLQCTGLRDKNGNLIYEGDILETEEGRVFCNFREYLGMIGFYLEKCFYSGGLIFDDKDPYYEIVGNIYENTELLKSNKED